LLIKRKRVTLQQFQIFNELKLEVHITKGVIDIIF